VCLGGSESSCDDDNPCTDDSCSPDNGNCLYEANEEACDDDNPCTLNDGCQDSTCQGDAVLCDDGVPCTVDICDVVTGCVHTPNNGACASGEICVTDTCDPISGCISDLTPNCCGNGLIEAGEECDDGNLNIGDGCNGLCLEEGVPGCYDDWLVGSSCNGVNYGNGCSPQDTGYHFMGIFNGYACWWHHKNQAWNTSTNSNFWALAQNFGVTPGTGKCGWCFNKFSTPDPTSLQGCDGYFNPNDVGAWGWCAESDPNSVGFVCLPDEGNGNCP